MYNSNFRKNKRILVLLLITIALSFFNFSHLIWNTNNSFTDSNSPNDFELRNELKISDYSSNFVNTGENMNITLHQSYLNNSFNTVLNASNPSNDDFKLPCPTDISFNTSFTQVQIEDIDAPNKTLTVEDDLGVEVINPVNYHFISFEVK